MRRLILSLALILSPLAAAACGETGDACAVPEGEYLAALPEGVEAPPALVFLHGFGGTGAGIMRNKGLVRGILARGYAVIAPQGLPFREGSKGGAWNSLNSERRRDDVAYLISVADDAAARLGVDRSRIVIGGFSGGGMMTWRMACDQPAAFAAYAPIAGLLWRPLPQACAGRIRMLHTHGWSDPVVPLEGRSVAGGRLTQGDLFHGLDILRDANLCAKDDPDEYETRGPYQIRRWTDCAPGSALEMALHPGGHSIPKGWSAMTLDWYEGL